MSKLISFPTAKLAKEKGFFIRCNAWYDANYTTDENPYILIRHANPHIKYSIKENSLTYLAPTQTELADWLFEKHNIDVIVLPVFRDGKCGYDSFLRTGWRYVVTKGDCIYLDHVSFSQHIEFELRESNKVDNDDETMEEFLDRYGIFISNDKKEVFEKGLVEALGMI